MTRVDCEERTARREARRDERVQERVQERVVVERCGRRESGDAVECNDAEHRVEQEGGGAIQDVQHVPRCKLSCTPCRDLAAALCREVRLLDDSLSSPRLAFLPPPSLFHATGSSLGWVHVLVLASAVPCCCPSAPLGAA